MSMAFVLKAARDHLRRELQLKDQECDIQPDGVPPAFGQQLYVALDESNVESLSDEHLHERFSIEVYTMIQTGKFSPDRQGDIYVTNLRELDRLDRAVIKAFHAYIGGTNDVRTKANAEFNLGKENQGDVFNRALFYRGRGKRDSVTAIGSKDTYMRRRLTFTGMDRVQCFDVVR